MRMLDWSLPGGQNHDFKVIPELAAGGGFAGEKGNGKRSVEE
jgi:hypothetical protein